MSESVDMQALCEVCREALDRYARIPIRSIAAEYNRRTRGVRVAFLSVQSMRVAMCLVPEGRISFRKNGAMWGIYRAYKEDWR